MNPTTPPSGHDIAADLIAVLVAVTDGDPRVLTIQDQRALPSGPFQLAHRSLQSGLRAWVERQTRLPLGYVEQLYTFADRDRAGVTAQHVISVSYLGLTREQPAAGEYVASWHGWYDYFPWEDHRLGAPPLIEKSLKRALTAWASEASDRAEQRNRRQRAAMLFGLDDHDWNEELILQRYELLYEAGLILEAKRGATDADLVGRNRQINDPRPPPYPRYRHRPAPCQDQISPCRVRIDAGYLHLAAIAALRGSLGGTAGAQAEFPKTRLNNKSL